MAYDINLDLSNFIHTQYKLPPKGRIILNQLPNTIKNFPNLTCERRHQDLFYANSHDYADVGQQGDEDPHMNSED